MICAVTSCRAAVPTPTATPTPKATPALAELRIEVLPAGSTVHINGEQRGLTPLRLDLPAGQYRVLVEHAGYSSLQRDVQLLAGQVALIAATLQDETAPVVDLPTPTEQPQATATVTSTSTPQPTPTLEPTRTPTPGVQVYETTITLSSYPYESYLREKMDSRYNWRVVWLDRAAYEAAGPRPQPRRFKAVVLENTYLSLIFLPELGGRLYQCIFKPIGQNIFYQNAVLKPSFWGPLSREENWWLAAGGMEWALPVHEHGYEWGLPWSYRIESKSDEASIILWDSTANDRLRAEIRVTLPLHRAYFVVQPSLTNPTAQPIAFQFWLNAQLTLGSPTTSPNTEFIYPTERMIVHSTGDSALPGERQIMPWPIADGRDLSHYGNWHNWLGVFVPEVKVSYTGAYNHDTNLGLVRIFPPEVARGLKLFGFGASFPARAEYTDDGSEYFEMWSGPCRTFWPEDEVTLGAGQSLGWSEVWLPFHNIGGLDKASSDVVIKAELQGSQVRLGIAASSVQPALLNVQWNGQAFYQGAVQLDPKQPLALLLPLPLGANPPGRLAVRLTDTGGKILLEYESVL